MQTFFNYFIIKLLYLSLKHIYLHGNINFTYLKYPSYLRPYITYPTLYLFICLLHIIVYLRCKKFYIL